MNEIVPNPDWLPSGANALQAFLKTHPDAKQQVQKILEKSLEKIDANTPTIVVKDLDNYFGREITDMLFDFVQPDLGGQLPEFSEIIPTEAMNFLKEFITQYGSKLVNLNKVSNQASAAALDAFLKSHPDAENQVREIIDKRLATIDANTWNSIFSSLDNYWGKVSTDILYNIAQSDQASRLQDLEGSVTPEVMNLLRKIISLYGPELANAFLASNQLPNNWKTFYRDVYYDYVNRRSHLRVRLAKYNGEEPFVEGNADSILELTILIMQTIRFLPVPDFISKSMSDRFIQEANELIKFLQSPTPEGSDRLSPNGSDTSAKAS